MKARSSTSLSADERTLRKKKSRVTRPALRGLSMRCVSEGLVFCSLLEPGVAIVPHVGRTRFSLRSTSCVYRAAARRPGFGEIPFRSFVVQFDFVLIGRRVDLHGAHAQ